MKKIVFSVWVTVFVLTSCTTGENSVKYVEAQNYFHRNDAPLPEGPKITYQAEFEKHFSAAAFMGKNGKVTDIDFTKSFVIVKVLPSTDRETELKPLKLLKTGKDKLNLVYSLHVGGKRSYTIQPMFILVLDNKYKNYVIDEAAGK